MHILFVEVHIKPEMRSHFLEVIADDAAHSEADEPGCLRFDVLVDSEDENKFYYYEVYRDEAALNAHRQTPHYERYTREMRDMADRETIRKVIRNVAPTDAGWR